MDTNAVAGYRAAGVRAARSGVRVGIRQFLDLGSGRPVILESDPEIAASFERHASLFLGE